MHPAGCNEGAHFDEKGKKGPCHEEGAKRWARQHSAQDDREGLWDAFCRSHMAEAQATSRASATQGSSCSGVVRAGGAKETVSNPHAGSRDAKGKKRPRQAPNKDVLISQNLALLAASSPRGWTDADDIPPPPQRRIQTHTDLEAGEILKMTTRVAMEYTKGMPRPKPDGTLTPGTGRWSGEIEDVMGMMGSLPFMPLPRARIRALKRKPLAGWDEASMALALADHVVSGTLVFVVPEIFNRKAMEADPYFRVLDEGTGEVTGVRMMCPACKSNKHTASKGWHKQLRAVHTSGESGNWFPLGYRYVCFSPTCPAVQKAVRRKVELAVGPAARVVGETTTGNAAGASSGGGVGGMAKTTSGTESGTGGAVGGTGVSGETGETVGAVGARGDMGGPDGRVRAKVASSAAKDCLATLPKEEVAALLNGDLRLATPAFLRRLLDGTASFLITDRSYMQYFPRSVQLCYNFDLFTKSGASHGLLTLVLSSGQSVAALTRDLQEVYNAEKVKKVEEYAHFAKDQGGTWPPYGTIGSGTVLSGPTEANTSTYMKMKYEELDDKDWEYHGFGYLSHFTEMERKACVAGVAKEQAGVIETMSLIPLEARSDPVDDELEHEQDVSPDPVAATMARLPTVEVPTVEGASLGGGLQGDGGAAAPVRVATAPVAVAEQVVAAEVAATRVVAAAQVVAVPVAEAAAAAPVVAASVASAGDSDEVAASELHGPGAGRGRRGKRRLENVFSAPSRKPTTPEELDLADRCLLVASAAPDGRANLYVAATAMYNRAFMDMIEVNRPGHLAILGMTSEKLVREHANSVAKQLHRQRLDVVQAPHSSGGAGSEPTPSTGAGSAVVAPPPSAGVGSDGVAPSSREGTGLAEAPSLPSTREGSEGAPSTGAGSEEVATSSTERSAGASRQLLRDLEGSVDGVDKLSGNACLRFLRKYSTDRKGLRNGLGPPHYRALVKKMLRDIQS